MRTFLDVVELETTGMTIVTSLLQDRLSLWATMVSQLTISLLGNAKVNATLTVNAR
jgi:uncharacterized membrane protein